MKLRLGLGLGPSSPTSSLPPVDDLVVAFSYDSIAQRTFDEGTEFNTEADMYFDSSAVFDVANGGAFLTKSTEFAVLGTTVNYIIDDDTDALSSQFAAYIALISEANRDLINTVIVGGGTNDGRDTSITKAHFKTYMSVLLTLLRANFSSLQKIVWIPLHRRESGSSGQDASYQLVKEAIYEKTSESASFVLGPEIYDTDMSDTIHPTTAEFENTISVRAAQKTANAYGKLSTGAIGPQITSASFSSDIVTATISQDLGDRLELKPNGTNVVKNATNGQETISGYDFANFSFLCELEDGGVPSANSRLFVHRIDGDNFISMLWFSNNNMAIQVEVGGVLVQEFYNSSVDFTDSGDKKRIGMSIDGAGNILLYVDGVERISDTVATTTGTMIDHYRLQTNSGAQVYSTGDVYDYSIYNTTLSATQLAEYTGNTFTSMGDFFALDGNGTIHTPTAITQSGNELALTFPSSSSPRKFISGYGTMSGQPQVNPSVLRDNAIVNLPLRQGEFDV